LKKKRKEGRGECFFGAPRRGGLPNIGGETTRSAANPENLVGKSEQNKRKNWGTSVSWESD